MAEKEMPVDVQYLFTSISSSGHVVEQEKGFTDDYSVSLEEFQDKQPNHVVRIVADLALRPDWKQGRVNGDH